MFVDPLQNGPARGGWCAPTCTSGRADRQVRVHLLLIWIWLRLEHLDRPHVLGPLVSTVYEGPSVGGMATVV